MKVTYRGHQGTVAKTDLHTWVAEEHCDHSPCYCTREVAPKGAEATPEQVPYQHAMSLVLFSRFKLFEFPPAEPALD